MLSDFLQKNTIRSRQSDVQKPQILISINYRTIKIIDNLPNLYSNIEELYLNHNLLESIIGLNQFTKLRILELKFNFLSRIEEFQEIGQMIFLTDLNLTGNPLEKDDRFSFLFFENQFKCLKILNGKNKLAFNKKVPKIQSFTNFPKDTQKISLPLQITATFAKSRKPPLSVDENERISFNFSNKKKKSFKEIDIISDKKIRGSKSMFLQKDFSFELNTSEIKHRDESGFGFDNSVLAQSHLNKHIKNIDEDLEELAVMFHKKGLKEKIIKCFKMIKNNNEKKIIEIQEYFSFKILSKIIFIMKLEVYEKKLNKKIIENTKNKYDKLIEKYTYNNYTSFVLNTDQNFQNTSKKIDSFLIESKSFLNKYTRDPDSMETSRNQIIMKSRNLKNNNFILNFDENSPFAQKPIEIIPKKNNKRYLTLGIIKDSSFNFPQPYKN